MKNTLNRHRYQNSKQTLKTLVKPTFEVFFLSRYLTHSWNNINFLKPLFSRIFYLKILFFFHKIIEGLIIKF